MTIAVDAALREEVRRAGLKGHESLVRLLATLRTSPDPHLTIAEASRLANAAGISASEIPHQLNELAELGLLGRLPSLDAEPLFDTEPDPHSHLIDEETSHTVDLHVSPETLLAIIRRELKERPDQIEILIRVRKARQ